MWPPHRSCAGGGGGHARPRDADYSCHHRNCHQHAENGGAASAGATFARAAAVPRAGSCGYGWRYGRSCLRCCSGSGRSRPRSPQIRTRRGRNRRSGSLAPYSRTARHRAGALHKPQCISFLVRLNVCLKLLPVAHFHQHSAIPGPAGPHRTSCAPAHRSTV